MQIVISGVEYVSARKLDTFLQLNIARKLGPATPVVEGLLSIENQKKDRRLLTVLMLSHISDEACEFVVKKCLSVVNRVQDGKHVPITTARGDLMFDDITMADMLELAVQIIEENLGDFFRTTLADLKASAGV